MKNIIIQIVNSPDVVGAVLQNLCHALFHELSLFSKHGPFGPMLSISRNVRPCVCLSVCVCSLLRYRLTVFLPPFPEVGCPIFLEIRNPWGKVMTRSGLTFENFCSEVV